MNYLILIIVGVAGVIIGTRLVRGRVECGDIGDGDNDLITEQSKQKSDNLKKALKFFENREEVTNNDIEQLLNVSNATAERYLNQLEKDGEIVQNGKTGISVFYTLK